MSKEKSVYRYRKDPRKVVKKRRKKKRVKKGRKWKTCYKHTCEFVYTTIFMVKSSCFKTNKKKKN